jgi:hypothetical protein
MTTPDELVRDGLRRIADGAAPVSGGATALTAQVIAGAERRHRRTLVTAVAAVAAVLVLGALTATKVAERRAVVPAGPVPFRHSVTAGPVAIGWYHMRGMEDDTDWVLNPATGRYRLLRGETIYDIAQDGRTALARPYAEAYPRQIDLVDLVHGTVTRLPLAHAVIDARWAKAPDGDKFVLTVTDTPPGADPIRSGFVLGRTDSPTLRFVNLPGPGGELPQGLCWAADATDLWSWDARPGPDDGLRMYGPDGRREDFVDLTMPTGAPAAVPRGPMVSPHDRYVLVHTADLTFRVYDVSTGDPVGHVGWPPDTDPLAWYDDTHLVVQRFDPSRTRERLVVVALDGHVTKVLTPWESASLRADFHAYRRG